MNAREIHKQQTQTTRKQTNDTINEQLGEPFIREHLETKGESIVLFGHCHWKTPYITLGENQLLNIDCRLYLFEKETT